MHVGANGEVWMLQEVRLVPNHHVLATSEMFGSWTLCHVEETWALVVEAPESNLFLDGTSVQGQRHLDSAVAR